MTNIPQMVVMLCDYEYERVLLLAMFKILFIVGLTISLKNICCGMFCHGCLIPYFSFGSPV